MDISTQALSVSLSPDASAVAADTSMVRAEPGRSMGADFQSVLEGFRQKSADVEAAGRNMIGAPGTEPANATERSMRQLTDLYTYAVDMQVMLRTSGQLTSGIRQLVTGQ
jgi:hypothetical protein